MYFKTPTSIALAKQALAIMRNSASQLRRQDMQKRIDFYFDKQKPYLDKDLRQQFKKYDAMKLQLEFFNLTRLIIDELSLIYNEEPQRTLDGAKESDQDIYDQIIQESQLNMVMDTALRLTKLCKTVLVKPTWRNEKIELDILTPNIFDVIQDEIDPTKMKAVIYSTAIDINNEQATGNNDTRTSYDPFADNQTVFYYWSDEKHFRFTYSLNDKQEVVIKLIDDANNPENINPYGVMPFVVLRDGYPIDQFFITGGDDVINVNEISNIKLTEKNFLTKMQSFSIPVRKGADSKAPSIILDPSMCIDLPADDEMGKGADFRFVTPDAKLEQIEADIEARLRRLAIKYHLNPDMFIASGNRSSADSLQLQNYRMGNIVKRDKPIFRLAEVSLFNLIRIIYNTYSKEKISESAELSVDFSNIEVPLTVNEQDQHNLLLVNNGVMTKKDWLRQTNKDILTDEQADDYLAEIEEEKQKALKTMQESMKQNLREVDNGQDDSQQADSEV